MNRMNRLSLAVLVLALGACSNSDPPPDPEAADDAGTDGSGPAVDGDDGESSGGRAPIALTDARLDKYLAYRKEYIREYAVLMKRATDFAKTVDTRSTDAAKAVTAAAGAVRLGEEIDKTLRDLGAKHGFSAEEDERLSSAISDVVAARPLENPATAAGFQSLRDMEARGGEDGKAAEEMLKNLEVEEQAALAAARARYGDACVEVLSRRVKELAQFQIDSVTGLYESGAAEE